jgi:hypothetical protein
MRRRTITFLALCLLGAIPATNATAGPSPAAPGLRDGDTPLARQQFILINRAPGRDWTVNRPGSFQRVHFEEIHNAFPRARPRSTPVFRPVAVPPKPSFATRTGFQCACPSGFLPSGIVFHQHRPETALQQTIVAAVAPSGKSAAFYRELSGGSVPRASRCAAACHVNPVFDGAAKLSISEI